MDSAVYRQIVDFVHSQPYLKRLSSLEERFPNIPMNTLKSIAGQECQRQMKCVHNKLTSAEVIEDVYARYKQLVSQQEEPGILQRISEEIGLTPALLARAIIDRHYQKPDKSKPAKLLISSLMKNTALIDDRDLAIEVYICVLEDNDYGPVAEAEKQSLGYEYEVHLKRELEQRNIAFLHEGDLRAKGYDKTPDIKLEIPIAIDGQVVNWIESKALFGDEEAHRGYLKDQLYSYWNRFGPGMVIYWFGFVQGLEKLHQDRKILIRCAMPDNIVFLDPTSTVDDPENRKSFS